MSEDTTMYHPYPGWLYSDPSIEYNKHVWVGDPAVVECAMKSVHFGDSNTTEGKWELNGHYWRWTGTFPPASGEYTVVVGDPPVATGIDRKYWFDYTGKTSEWPTHDAPPEYEPIPHHWVPPTWPYDPYPLTVPDMPPPPPPTPAPAAQGWQCPRCGKVHAPWVASCDCHQRTITSGSTNIDLSLSGDAMNTWNAYRNEEENDG